MPEHHNAVGISNLYLQLRAMNLYHLNSVLVSSTLLYIKPRFRNAPTSNGTNAQRAHRENTITAHISNLAACYPLLCAVLTSHRPQVLTLWFTTHAACSLWVFTARGFTQNWRPGTHGGLDIIRSGRQTIPGLVMRLRHVDLLVRNKCRDQIIYILCPRSNGRETLFESFIMQKAMNRS